jgi:signal transduction histidine kinase/CheY-like chemotaxis protein
MTDGRRQGDRLEGVQVLVVEDENIVAKDIELTLKSLGYSVCGIAGTGEQAIRLAREQRPELILMDVRLRGDMDGIEAAQQIRSFLDVPIVYLTAFADEATIQRARQSGPYGYVLKPFEDRELQAATALALYKHQAFEELTERVRQIAAVADLGSFALRSQELQPVFDRAAATVCHTLGADVSAIFELLPGGDALRLRAGVGWREGAVGNEIIPGGRDSQPGFTLVSDEPVIVDDLKAEKRFTGSSLLHEAGVVSGMTVIIPGLDASAPYGVLGTHTRSKREFSKNDVMFLQAVANLVAAAVVRLEADRRAEEERVKAAQAQEAVRLRDEFLALVAHELKTPLTSLQLQMQSLAARMDALDGKLALKVGRATRSTDRLSALIENLLDVSRLTNGWLDLQPELIDLSEVAAEVVDRIRPEAEEAGCEIRIHAAPRVSGHWDRLRIEQVLMNLLSNAIRHGAGFPIEVRVALVGACAEISVTDRGPGIEAKDVTRIFERFERATSMRHYGGLGLGLYIAREVVQAHGGSVQVQSEPGRGAQFRVRLPVRARRAAAQGAQPPPGGSC